MKHHTKAREFKPGAMDWSEKEPPRIHTLKSTIPNEWLRWTSGEVTRL